METQRNILITGTSGYLGAYLAEHLSKIGYRVTGIAGRKDLCSEKLERLTVEFDAIIHAGFEVDFSPVEAGKTSENVLSTQLISDYARSRKIPHLVFLSAAGVLGVSAKSEIRNEKNVGECHPDFKDYLNTQYIQDKLACEGVLKGLPTIVTTLYLTTVYGEGMKCDTVKSLLKLKTFNPIAICPPGGTSFLALDDFRAAIETVLASRPAGGFVISSGNISYSTLISTAAEALGVKYRKRIVPLPNDAKSLIRFGGNLLSGKILSTAVLESAFGYKYYSAEKARRSMGWKPKTRLLETLKNALTQ